MANNIDYTQPYVSADEYLAAKGVNLEIELQDDDNKSNKVVRFVKDLTEYVRSELVREYLDNDLNETVTAFESLAEWRRKRFHAGMIEQIEYVLNNGLIHQDSGISKETGQILDYSNIVISRSAKAQFWLGGFCNIKRA